MSNQAIQRRATFLVVGVIAVGLVILSTDSVIGWMVPIVLIGGGLVAFGLARVHARPGDGEYAFDANASRDLSQLLNVSSVRVAGIGGAGLLAVSALIAVKYPLVNVAVVTGVLGGLLGAIAVIRYRRRHGVLQGSAGLSTPSVVPKKA